MNPASNISHLTDNQLVLLYYREPLERSDLEGHLAGCAECLGRFQNLSRVLHLVAQDEIPEPGADFEERMAAQVLSAASNPERGRLLPFFSRTMTRSLIAGAALAASLILSFSVGRQVGRVEEQPLTAAQTQERILLTALGEHLGRSRVTLVELKNREVSATDLKALQAAAENLVTASRLFRAAAERARETQIAELMDETERLLIRFTVAPDAEARSALVRLRQRVDSRDLLFRLQVMEARVEKREKDIVPSSNTSL